MTVFDGKREFYQWDLDQRLIVNDADVTEVHYCNQTDDCALVCEVYEDGEQRVVDIPNILFQEAFTIRAYAYTGCYTKEFITLTVKPRSKPTDYVYTETEVKRWDEFYKRLDELELGARAIIDVEALPTEDINTALLYRVPEGVFWFDGAWHKVVDEGEFENELNGKQDNIVFDGEYDAETNKAATVQTIVNKVAELIAGAPEDFNTLKELADWLTTHGGEAAKMNSDIKKNTEDITAINEGLKEYVKNTDYATSSKAGVMKAIQSKGFIVDADGFGAPSRANINHINGRYSHRWLDAAWIDTVLSVGVAGYKKVNDVESWDNQIDLGEKGRASAQKWLGVPTDLDEFTEKILTDESLAVKYTAEEYPFSYLDDSFGLASTDILSIDELDCYAVTVYFDRWLNGETETVTYLLSELNMVTDNYGYRLSTGNAKIYIVTDHYAFADAFQIPVTSNGLYFSKYNGPNENINIISVDRLPIKKIDGQYLDIPKASLTQYGLVKTYGELTSNIGYEGCKTYNGTLYTKNYTNEKSGQIYGTSSTAETTTIKTVSDYAYTLTKYGIVAIKFNNAVPANSTLSIGSGGAKSIYYRGKAITSNVIKAGDIATFMYNGSQYVLLSVDRWHEDIANLSARIEALENKA